MRKALRDRGVWDPGPLASRDADLDAVEGAIRWFDQQRRREPDLSAAPLIKAILDGGMPGYGQSASTGPCPLDGPDRELLAQTWKALDAQLIKRVGHTWELWGEGVHLHEVGQEFVVACPPHSQSWVVARYHLQIAAAAVVPVRFVVCEGGER